MQIDMAGRTEITTLLEVKRARTGKVEYYRVANDEMDEIDEATFLADGGVTAAAAAHMEEN